MPSSIPLSDRGRSTLRRITISAMLLCILLAQEYLLMGIPNVQLTVALLMVYAVVLPWAYLIPLLIGYVFLDNLLMGSLNIIYFVPMMAAWLFLVFGTKLLAKKPLGILTVWATLFGFVYGWFFALAQVVVFHVDFWVYLTYDLEFEVLMAITNLITVAFVFPILRRTLDSLLNPKSPDSTEPHF